MFQLKSRLSAARLLVLPALMLMSAGWAQAADEAVQSKLTAPAAYLPTASNRLLTQWTGSENLCNFGPLTFQLYEGGRAVMTDARSTSDGVWQQNGQQLTLWFGGGRVVYSGTIANNVVSGTAVNGPSYWGWSAQSVAVGAPIAVPTQWAGSENLCNYGQLTFQFYDAGRVAMLDRKSILEGTFQQNGQQITMQFDGGRVQYTGTLSANAIFGSAHNECTSWSWSVNRLAS